MKKCAVFVVAAFCAWGFVRSFAGVVPVPFGDAANTSFADAVDGDRKGGWTDQGGHDLKVMKPGRLELSGIPFDILSDEKTAGKSCMVLGGAERSYLPRKAELSVNASGGEEQFYILHGGAWCPANNDILAVLNFKYEDGTLDAKHIRGGRDIMDWCQPTTVANAARVWTEYNGNTQVSLFLSKFRLKEGKKLKSVEFVSSNVVWMVVAAAVGEDKTLTPIKSTLKVTRKFAAPVLEAPLVQRKTDKPPRNIILVIGDGMGRGACDLTSLWTHGETNRLVMQQLPVSGQCKTFSKSSSVTDSAAAATAIACGMKVNNSNIGVTPEGRRLKSLAEAARDRGISVGLVTSDSISGATPACFFAHQALRGMAPEIVVDAAACGFEIIIGNAGTRGLFMQNGKAPDQRNLQKEMESRGYQFISTLEEFAAVPGSGKVLGQVESKIFTEKDTALSEFARMAMDRLEKDPDGFFMMVESTYPDKGGHGNDPTVSVMGTVHADWVAKAAVEYAAARGDTLVICTADHETGSLSVKRSSDGGSDLEIAYGGTSHSGAMVPLSSFGPGAELFRGEIDNTEIAHNIAKLWGLEIPVVVE